MANLTKFRVLLPTGDESDGWIDLSRVEAVEDLAPVLFKGNTEITMRSGRRFAVMEPPEHVLALVRDHLSP